MAEPSTDNTCMSHLWIRNVIDTFIFHVHRFTALHASHRYDAWTELPAAYPCQSTVSCHLFPPYQRLAPLPGTSHNVGDAPAP